PGESSSDVAFDSHSLIYENGALLAESQRFLRMSQLILADVDLELLVHDRLSSGTFGDCSLEHLEKAPPYRRVTFEAWLPASFTPLRRNVERHPFVPKDVATLAKRCWEVFEIQTNALMTRMNHFGNDRLILALSGGRDSTLAALACINALDQMGIPRTHLQCMSMPGLGTTAHTRAASARLAKALGATFEEQDIREECFLVLKAQGHRAVRAYEGWLEAQYREEGKDGTGARGEGVHTLPEHSMDWFVQFLSEHPETADVELENVQARIRKLRPLTRANRYQEPGHYALEIGTGDLSEKALGWSTYGGDHIGMYDLNPGIPKTLVELIIRWVATERVGTWAADPGRPAQNEENAAELKQALFDVLEAPISPELLPASTEGRIAQLTEKTLGPYELHDFFLHWFIRHRARPARIAFLAEHAFEGAYEPAEIQKWLREFFRRFFASQWKRDCTPDGPKVGAVALSPRGDWRMPSDAVATSWLREIDSLGRA
ncbi:MAG TPA: NAD(+) synthase, partial [Chloroflexota bacterium]|nr:NAD(+) synthase [Chloroflexota bacterium]